MAIMYIRDGQYLDPKLITSVRHSPKQPAGNSSVLCAIPSRVLVFYGNNQCLVFEVESDEVARKTAKTIALAVMQVQQEEDKDKE